ncbi:MAG: nucleotidyl transferase AbiEii/AbiGii toxin family protein [Oscillospiraceae bacterium]|jgi:hypothetical protein|nr:nucleotidyl transferase AbiEii/AbiGii toxin family protein [Oscillospiraceae bacterium]
MILEQSFTKAWLLDINKALGWNRQETQLKNLEKAIAALYLLERLVAVGMNFIFKGGTSLLLLLGEIHRLSVDIDVIIEKPIAGIEKAFDEVCLGSKLFTRFMKDERNNASDFDTTHYKFFYKSFMDAQEESYILLDLCCTANPYAKLMKLEISSDILRTDGTNLFVALPDVNSILGDKLTAFAPETIGVKLSAEPGHRPKRIEVLKQLFDVGNLFDHAQNAIDIRKTYWAVAEHQIQQFGLNITPEDALRDTFHHAQIIAFGGKLEKECYENIQKGFKDFSKFVSDLSFDKNRAELDAAKAAYLVTVLLKSCVALEKYNDAVDMSDWIIQDPAFAPLNDAKFTNPEAFFYWMKALHESN